MAKRLANGQISISVVEGVSVTSTQQQYYLSTSKSVVQGGTWLDECPLWQPDRYLWKRLEITYSDGRIEYTEHPEVDSSWEAVNYISIADVNIINGSRIIELRPNSVGAGTSVLISDEEDEYRKATPDEGKSTSLYVGVLLTEEYLNNFGIKVGDTLVDAIYTRHQHTSAIRIARSPSSADIGVLIEPNVWTQIYVIREAVDNYRPSGLVAKDTTGKTLLPNVPLDYKKLSVCKGNKVTEWKESLKDTEDAISDAKEAGTIAQSGLSNLTNQVNNLDTEINEALVDGLDSVEKESIKEGIYVVENLYDNKIASFNAIYNNPYLPEGNEKVALGVAKTSFESNKDALITAINNLINAASITPILRTAYNVAYSNFNTSATNLQIALENANNKIQEMLDNIAAGYVDDLIIGAVNYANGTSEDFVTVIHVSQLATDIEYELLSGQEVTYSVYLKSDDIVADTIHGEFAVYSDSGNNYYTTNVITGDALRGNGVIRLQATVTLRDVTYTNMKFYMVIRGDAVSGTVYAKQAQIEVGSKATSWKPSIADNNKKISDLEQKLLIDLAAINDDLQKQLDGEVSNWFFPYIPTSENIPESIWVTEELKSQHIGDTFTNTADSEDTSISADIREKAGHSWRYVYEIPTGETEEVFYWTEISDNDATKALNAAKDAQATADGKCTTYLEPPLEKSYNVGDIWILNANGYGYLKGDLLVANTASSIFSISHWSKEIRYTDDTALDELVISGVNLMDNSNDVNLFQSIYGSVVTNAVVSEFGFDDAVSVEVTGGTSISYLAPYIADSMPANSETRYSMSFYFKNTSEINTIRLLSNWGGRETLMAPGESKLVKWENMSYPYNTSLRIIIRDSEGRLGETLNFIWSRVMFEEATRSSPWRKSEYDINSEIKDAKDASTIVQLNLDNLSSQVTSLDDSIDDALKDGTLDAVEKQSILSLKTAVNSIYSEKISSYTVLYENEYLYDPENPTSDVAEKEALLAAKTALYNTFTLFNTAIVLLTNTSPINDEVREGYNSAYTNFNNALINFQTAVENADSRIQETLDKLAEGYVDQIVIGSVNYANGSTSEYVPVSNATKLITSAELEELKGKEIIFSVYLKGENAIAAIDGEHGEIAAQIAVKYEDGTTRYHTTLSPIDQLNGEVRCIGKVKLEDLNITSLIFYSLFRNHSGGTVSGNLFAKQAQIEVGNKITDWKRSAADLEIELQAIQTAADNVQAEIDAMNADSVFDINEKYSIRDDWFQIQGAANTTGSAVSGGSYYTAQNLSSIGASASKVTVAKGELTTAYVALKTRLDVLGLYSSFNTYNFNRTELSALFATYYNKEKAVYTAVSISEGIDRIYTEYRLSTSDTDPEADTTKLWVIGYPSYNSEFHLWSRLVTSYNYDRETSYSDIKLDENWRVNGLSYLKEALGDLPIWENQGAAFSSVVGVVYPQREGESLSIAARTRAIVSGLDDNVSFAAHPNYAYDIAAAYAQYDPGTAEPGTTEPERPNFLVTDEGILYANNADIRGNLTGDTIEAKGSFVYGFKSIDLIEGGSFSVKDNAYISVTTGNSGVNLPYENVSGELDGFSCSIHWAAGAWCSVNTGSDITGYNSLGYIPNQGGIATFIFIDGGWRFSHGSFMKNITPPTNNMTHPDGHYECWGTGTTGSNGLSTISFGRDYQVAPNIQVTTIDNIGSDFICVAMINNETTSNFTVVTRATVNSAPVPNIRFRWRAIGY